MSEKKAGNAEQTFEDCFHYLFRFQDIMHSNLILALITLAKLASWNSNLLMIQFAFHNEMHEILLDPFN